MNRMDTVLLAAKTARSNAYAQALMARGIRLKAAVLFGEGGALKPGQASYVPESNWPNAPVFLPDFSLPLEKILPQVCDAVITVEAAHVNDDSVQEALSDLSPKLIVYSGYGSQIVGERVLAMGVPFLHLHAGWLPEFRGSTTTYYHLLATGHCGVSAIILEKEIDTGPILARKTYPRPPADVDIDYLYDGSMRGDLLVEVLEHYEQYGTLPHVEDQHPLDGNTYYVIHPVLKHLAILSLGATGGEKRNE